MANTLEGHRTGILNWYDFPISTGRLEGINNKIGALQRMAYGYRDPRLLHRQTLCTPSRQVRTHRKKQRLKNVVTDQLQHEDKSKYGKRLQPAC